MLLGYTCPRCKLLWRSTVAGGRLARHVPQVCRKSLRTTGAEERSQRLEITIPALPFFMWPSASLWTPLGVVFSAANQGVCTRWCTPHDPLSHLGAPAEVTGLQTPPPAPDLLNHSIQEGGLGLTHSPRQFLGWGKFREASLIHLWHPF